MPVNITDKCKLIPKMQLCQCNESDPVGLAISRPRRIYKLWVHLAPLSVCELTTIL